MIRGGIKSDHPVEDAHEEDRYDEQEREVGDLLAQEVGVSAVQTVAVLPQQHGDLVDEDLRYGHILRRIMLLQSGAKLSLLSC